MKSSLADRLLLVFVLEISALLVAVSSADGLADRFAASPSGDRWVSSAIAAALVVAWIAVPVVLLVRGIVDDAERFTRYVGWSVLALGVVSAFVSPHGNAAVTLSVLGALLVTYSARGRR